MVSMNDKTQGRIVEKVTAVTNWQKESGKQPEMFEKLRQLCRPMRALHKSINIMVWQVVWHAMYKHILSSKDNGRE